MSNYSKSKPTTLNFCETLLSPPNQLTPSTQHIINCFQDDTPTNFKYILDTPDKEDFGVAFNRHYKSIEEGYQRCENINNYNTCFTLDMLNSDDDMTGQCCIQRPAQSVSRCSSDIQSSSSSSGNKLSSSSYNESSSSINNDPLKLTAKKRERNRLAAEKCRVKKQRKIQELENERQHRIQENNKLLERVNTQAEKLKNLQLFYHKLISGEIKPRPGCH